MEQSIYLIILVLIFSTALYQLSFLVNNNDKKQKIKFRRKRLNTLLVDENSKEVKDIDYLFVRSGINISGKQYQLMRYITLIVFFVLWVLNLLLYKKNTIALFIAIALFLVTLPKEKIFNLKSPFSYMLEFFTKEYQKKKDLELYSVVSQLKNICITAKGSVGTDYALNEIVQYTKYTRPIFIKFMSLWDINKKEDAVNYFSKNIGSAIGKELGNILYKFDNLSGIELIDQLDVYQNNVRQEKETIRNKIQERNTTILFAMGVVVIILIVLNLLLTIVVNNIFMQMNYIL